MVIYKDADYNWVYSEGRHALAKLSLGRVISADKENPKNITPFQQSLIDTYSVRDPSEISEKRWAALGLYHLIEILKDGTKRYSGLKINSHRWEKDFYEFAANLLITRGTLSFFAPDGSRKWLNINFPAQYDSVWQHVMAYYTQIFGSKISTAMQIAYAQSMYMHDRGVD